LDYRVRTCVTSSNPCSLCTQFANLELTGQSSTTPVQGATQRMLQIETETSDTKHLMIEVSQRGGCYDTPTLLQLYCLGAQAFIITFCSSSRASFHSSGKVMDAIVKAGREGCPIALVGMQKICEPVAVMEREASERAAELGAKYFSVQTGVSDQVMAPFVYLGRHHLQGSKTSCLPEIGKVVPQSLWHVSHTWIWSCCARCVSRGKKARSDVWFG